MKRAAYLLSEYRHEIAGACGLIVAVIALCVGTGVVGPTLDARAASHSAQR